MSKRLRQMYAVSMKKANVRVKWSSKPKLFVSRTTVRVLQGQSIRTAQSGFYSPVTPTEPDPVVVVEHIDPLMSRSHSEIQSWTFPSVLWNVQKVPERVSSEFTFSLCQVNILNISVELFAVLNDSDK